MIAVGIVSLNVIMIRSTAYHLMIFVIEPRHRLHARKLHLVFRTEHIVSGYLSKMFRALPFQFDLSVMDNGL